ncbi:hypothetical protein FB451DRAFT_1399530 [Mycena latifolia]|nr:hypothetical protein FB451DRAFT_1399530 [Mycena latifolia]
MSSLHPSELRITVVEDLDWPALQDTAILTPNSLWPQDVTLDDALSVSRLTPNSISGKFAWPKTPSTSHTFGFPLSARSATSNFPPEAPENQTPLERHKRRLKRYHAAESSLARLPAPSPLSPRQMRADTVRYAASHVAAHVADARQCLRGVLVSGRRDSSRWMAEHRLAALESLQRELASLSVAQVRDGEEDSRRKREANLVRFLGTHRDDGLVPVFTRSRGRHRPPAHAVGETERRCMTVGSPMKLQSGGLPVASTSRHEWPWETRVRSVLLYPAPKPPEAPLRILTETPTSGTLSTPTSGEFSPVEPETPLTELEDEGEDFEDYPRFKPASASSRAYKPSSSSLRTTVPASRTRALKEADDEDDDSYNHEDYPTFKSDSAQPHPYNSRRPPAPSRLSVTPPEDEDDDDDDDDDDGYADNYEDYPAFPVDSALSYAPPPPPPRPPLLPPLRTAKADLPPDATYAWLADSATWAAPSAWHGDGWEVGPPSASGSGSAASTPSSSSTASPTSALTPRMPRTPARSQTLPDSPASSPAPAPAHRFWSRVGAHRRAPSLLPIVEAGVYATKPLPAPPPPSQKKEKEKAKGPGRHFFSGLVPVPLRRPPPEAVPDPERRLLRKSGSIRSLRSARSGQSVRSVRSVRD